MLTTRVGIDLGGTHVRAAAVATNGDVLASVAEPIVRDDDPRATPFAQLADLVRGLGDRVGSRASAVGVGVTGPVDAERGWVDNPHTLPPNLQGDLRGVLQGSLGVPVAVVNDADAAALGEQAFGVARGAEVLVAVTVGTGVGVGVVAGGRVVTGAAGGHGEAGHMVVDPAGPPCYCGARGCLESLASGTALARAAGVATGREALETADATVVFRARDALATGVRNLVAVHAPDAVVLSGGALAPGAQAAAQAAVDAFTMGGPVRAQVHTSTLGDLAACLGAVRSS